MIPEYRVREGPPVGVAQQYQRMGDISLAPGALCRKPAGSPSNPVETNGAG